MKNLIFFLLLAWSVTAQAQSGSHYRLWSDTNDTLGAYTTNTYDLNTLAFGGNLVSDTWSYSIDVEADSLSGSAADSSNVYLQTCNCDFNTVNPIWHNLQAVDIDGTATQTWHWTGDIEGARLRIVASTQSGTKAIATRFYVTLKRKYRNR
jgi:hypothetical protein